MSTTDRLAEIQARWVHIPTDEQPRITVTNSSRGCTLLNALGHARTDVDYLLREVLALQSELAAATDQLQRLDGELVRLRDENRDYEKALAPDGRAA